MTMPAERLGQRELAMPKEMKLVMLDLTSKVGAFAHTACNGHTCTETGPLGCFHFLVLCSKLDIFRYCNKMGE